jgi:AraC-like DNA-binding protein
MIENIPYEVDDPLSDAFTKIKLQAFINVALDAGGKWAVDFPAYKEFTFSVVRKGECWLSMRSDERRVHLRAGDCFLLTGGKEFSLASSLSLERRYHAEELFLEAPEGVVTCNGGGDFLVVGTMFKFEGHLPSLFFGRLPSVIHIDGSSDQAAVLRWNLDRFGAEMRSVGLGRSLMLSHLAPIMLLQIMRIYLASSPKEENWLAALQHPRLSPVLEAMQADYQRDWSLEQFAKLANMSRAGFALTFKKTVGVSPMVYLMNWRMQIACKLLEAENSSLSAVATTVGYASESAFSTAFTKVVGSRPGAYRKPTSAPREWNNPRRQDAAP